MNIEGPPVRIVEGELIRRETAALLWRYKMGNAATCPFCGHAPGDHLSRIRVEDGTAIGSALRCRACELELVTAQVVCWVASGSTDATKGALSQ